MSAFIVSPRTLGQVLSAALYFHSYRPGEFPGLESEDGPALLVTDLHALNVGAVNQRYPGFGETPTPPTSLIREALPEARFCGEFLSRGTLVTWCQVSKSIQCFLYQCSEGDFPEQPLFQKIRKLHDSVNRHIVSLLPAYQAALWE